MTSSADILIETGSCFYINARRNMERPADAAELLRKAAAAIESIAADAVTAPGMQPFSVKDVVVDLWLGNVTVYVQPSVTLPVGQIIKQDCHQ